MDINPVFVAAPVIFLAVLLMLFLLARQAVALQRLRLLGEQALAGQRQEAETLRVTLASTERALVAASAVSGGQLRQEVAGGLSEMRGAMDARLRELREGNEARLGEIQKTVNEQLHAAVEKQMSASFARVTEQFAAVQKAMGDVQAVTAQIGDIKRLFGNVRTRGGWGETQLRAMLDDILPAGAYVANFRPRPESSEVVEFAVVMPSNTAEKLYLPIDSKFPLEDYERMLVAAEAGDGEAEGRGRQGLARQLRLEARKIAEKYIHPPVTVNFAVLYLPTDGLYVEAAQIPGLVDELGRTHRVILLGPSLFPALLRTIQLGHMTLQLELKTGEIGRLLGATRTEMERIDGVFAKLGKQAGALSNTIDSARVRTRKISQVLRSVESMEAEIAEELLGTEDGGEEESKDLLF